MLCFTKEKSQKGGECNESLASANSQWRQKNQYSFTTSTHVTMVTKKTDSQVVFAINVSKDIEGSLMLRETAV